MKKDLSHVNLGDTLLFGRYPREADGTVRPLVWKTIGLDEEQNRILVLCRDIIDMHCYHEENRPVSWEKSELRNWLITDFVNAAFDADEQENLMDSFDAGKLEFYDLMWDCEERIYQYTPVIMDPVFLLHPEDLFALFPYDQEKRCFAGSGAKMTPYVMARYRNMPEHCRDNWWLRATRRWEPHACFQARWGKICCTEIAKDSLCGVRPAMWLRR
ncbi:MAG: hypothetical protein IJ343_12685 [Clostridia bacterium]|nr:hypothetical protein [Clostridia bacterium]